MREIRPTLTDYAFGAFWTALIIGGIHIVAALIRSGS